jgi:hypothetical protein
MSKHLLAVAGLGVILFGAVHVVPLRADEWDKQTDITVNEPISVDGTILARGEYVLKLANSDSNRDVVQIYNQDQRHLITTVLAMPAYRVEPTGKPVFSFYETPVGHARELRTYFYQGDLSGFEFPERP